MAQRDITSYLQYPNRFFREFSCLLVWPAKIAFSNGGIEQVKKISLQQKKKKNSFRSLCSLCYDTYF